MKNKYMLVPLLLFFISTAFIFFTSKQVIDDPLGSTNCNCSGPKASKLEPDSN